MSVPLSVLDLVPVPSGASATDAYRRSVDLARRADALGYVRYWFAEHHAMVGIASSSPAILIDHIASATSRIRVGAGGIMLPNHVPLVLAEQFHTLEALHPGRIDLCIGRAHGTDMHTARVLRAFPPDEFPQQLHELVSLSDGHPVERGAPPTPVVPAGVRLPPIWLLASSGASAGFAAANGFGYAFARHFSPTPPAPAMRAYRERFEPSARFPRPHAILAVSVVCAETTAEAERLAASLDLAWVRFARQEFRPFPSPDEARAHPWTDAERATAEVGRARHFVGTPDAVRARIDALVEGCRADEVMITSMMHAHPDRVRSYELLADVFALEAAGPAPLG